MTGFLLLLAVAATLAVFATTRRGREILKQTRFRDRVPGAASTEDVEFLRSACGGDLAEVERRLDKERAHFPDLSEAEHYRRAIRKVVRDRED